MGFDIVQSRNGYNERCKWWSRKQIDNEEVFDNELVYKRIPDGMFMAKEVNAVTDVNNVLQGVVMVKRTNVTLKSADDLSGLSSEDIVEYDGEIWFVTSVQRSKARMQNTYFAKDRYCSHYWYLELRK